MRLSGRRTELCSVTVVTTRAPGLTSPWMAAFSAAVALAAKQTWSARGQPRSAATFSRHSQTTRPASRDSLVAPRPGFPRLVSAWQTASTTHCGRMTLVAALSR